MKQRSTKFAMFVIATMLAGTAAAQVSAPAGSDPQLARLLGEAAQANPDLLAARRALEAARHRIAPSAALDDPMLELGVLNYPLQSRNFTREDMTMKMIGIAQRLPYPGKRALRRAVAEREADVAEQNVQEVANKVRRDLKVAYFELALVEESQRVTEKNLRLMEQLSAIAESRYGLGQATQSDVLKAQTQRARMQEELLKLGRERPMLEAELARLLGAAAAPAAVGAGALQLREVKLPLEELRSSARATRPQLLAQERAIERNARLLDMARREYYPDFDVRFSYGQRDNLDVMRREDMVSLTVAINLPIWRGAKLEPRVAEAQAMRDEAATMYQAKLNETDAMLRQQVAAAEQALRSARLYDAALLPQARLAADAALSAYRVGRVEFMTLLDSQLTVFNAELGHAAAVTSQNKALAEIELLTGRELF